MALNNILDNRLLITLTICYIGLAIIFYYFNNKPWMQYQGKAAESQEIKNIALERLRQLLDNNEISQEVYNQEVAKVYKDADITFDTAHRPKQILDDISDKIRSTRIRIFNLFLKNKLLFYIVFGGIGFISLFLAWLSKPIAAFNQENDIPLHYFRTIILIILFFGMLFGLIGGTFYYLSYTPITVSMILVIINILIIIGAITFVFNKTNKNSSTLILGLFGAFIGFFISGWTGSFISAILGSIFGSAIGVNEMKDVDPRKKFVIDLLGLIPCLFINFAGYIKKQFNITSKKTWIILAIELLLIGLRFLIPFLYKLFKKWLMPNANEILTNPVSLHNQTNLGVFLSKNEIKDHNYHEETYNNYNYAISFKLFIMAESESTSKAYTEPTSLVNLSNIIKVIFNKEQIEFWAATTSSKISSKELIKVYEEKNILFQKWNNYIINYSGGTLDIFINNKLVSSTPNITPIINYQIVTAGQKDGIFGGIKNFVYYPNTLNKRQINIVSSM
tara:strand:- start:224 stop:1738 length:1515 start_codon:yes stop_codon:yes gene_type:complete